MKNKQTAREKFNQRAIENDIAWKKLQKLSDLILFLFIASFIAQVYGLVLTHWVWAVGIITFIVAIMIDSMVQFKKGKILGYLEGSTDALNYVNAKLDEQSEELKGK